DSPVVLHVPADRVACAGGVAVGGGRRVAHRGLAGAGRLLISDSPCRGSGWLRICGVGGGGGAASLGGCYLSGGGPAAAPLHCDAATFRVAGCYLAAATSGSAGR